jgi:hypothetical protein
MVEQATAQDEEYRLREEAGEQNTDSEDNDLAADLSPSEPPNRFFHGG